ncbi:MAG: RluA family pseudouridine synthase [Proteobacteria bacterium]|nr:RluA family pseudouridine synthase [Pseudomonadota bacterium]
MRSGVPTEGSEWTDVDPDVHPIVRRFRFNRNDGSARHGAPQAAESTSRAAKRPRLDHFLANCDLDLTRSQIKRMIERGDVAVGDKPVTRPGHRLRRNDEIRVIVRPPAESTAVAQTIPIEVVYEDRYLIAVDKPAGLVVHPAPGHPDRTLVNALLAHCDDLSGVGGELRPGIVHRLDKDTSGVMVASKDDATHRALVEMFKRHDLRREYIAVVAPPPRSDRGTFSTLHGRHPTNRKKFSSRVSRGKQAVTHYRVIERYDAGVALVRCRLETGRSHQIRVHFAEKGSPVVGDPLYGSRHGARIVATLGADLHRQALHATLLAFVHPITGQHLCFETEPPNDMRGLMDALRDR